MSYRMRRMVLVNLGTNQKTTSGLITAIDPRDGAAVVGANGVGKTTTLRLIPLFFGHLPSQIVAAGKGQEAMLRFVLPTAHSAIVFEYQRGPSEEHDIRTAVIRRRQDGTDAPEYRFFNSRFREELFKVNDIFLDDEQSTEAARKQEVTFTQKLNGADYRAVILGLRALSKDALKIRRLAGEFSFGPKPLPNMDRLVAAMVKERINFSDLIQVAVGMVQEELGTAMTTERGNLALKQSKATLAQWIIDREMCAQSVNLRPRSNELYAKVDSYSKQETVLRTMRVDVQTLRKDRITENATLTTKLTSIASDRTIELEEEMRKSELLEQVLTDARVKNTSAVNAYEEEKARLDNFTKKDASGWMSRLDSLPSLEIKRKGLAEEAQILEEGVAIIEREHEARLAEIGLQTAQESQRLEKAKAVPRQQYDSLMVEIHDRERYAYQQLSDGDDLASQAYAHQLSELTEEKSKHRVYLQNPTSSSEMMAGVKEVNDRLQKNARETQEVFKLLTELRQQHSAKKTEFHRLESTLVTALQGVKEAKIRLQEAESMNAPAPGTLLASLRDHQDQKWANNLAKVIDVSLLQRSDLYPSFGEDGDTLYGWHLDTDAIAVPNWTRDDRNKELITDRKVELTNAETYEDEVRNDIAKASKALSTAHAEVDVQEIRFTILEAQSESLNDAKETAAEKQAAEIKNAIETAQQALSILNAKEKYLADENRERKHVFGKEKDEVRQKALAESRAAAAKRDQAEKEIDAQIIKFQAEQDVRISDLKRNRKQRFDETGTDPEVLDALKTKLRTCGREIEAIQENEPLVSRYQVWQTEGGRSLVVNAEKKSEEQKKIFYKLQEDKEALTVIYRQSNDAFEKLRRMTQKRKDDVEEEVRSLEILDDRLSKFAPTGYATVDLKAEPKAMMNRVYDGLKKLGDIEKEIRDEGRKLKSALCSKESAVKNFIDTSLKGVNEDDAVQMAVELHSCQQRMGQQVIHNVNLTLTTVLATISSFHRNINAFEKEISRFNSRLQAALGAVSEFERVKEVKIEITSNFKDVDFIRKLENINDFGRDHRAQIGRDLNNDVPTDSIAFILQDFMSVIGGDGTLEINLASHVSLQGSVVENGTLKTFKRATELEHISSNGLTSIILITLLSGLLNMIRGTERVHVAWVTDEVGKFDGKNFIALMQLLKDNLIDVVTASPDISPLHYKRFANRYKLDDGGVIRVYVPKQAAPKLEGALL